MTISVVYTRYLLDIGWFKKWKTYVGYDQWDQTNKGKAHPGPIDNSPLLKERGNGSIDIYHHHHFHFIIILFMYRHYVCWKKVCILSCICMMYTNLL